MLIFIAAAFIAIAAEIAAVGCALAMGGEIARSTLRAVVGKSRFAIAERSGRMNTRGLRITGVLMVIFDIVFAWSVLRAFLK